MVNNILLVSDTTAGESQIESLLQENNLNIKIFKCTFKALSLRLKTTLFDLLLLEIGDSEILETLKKLKDKEITVPPVMLISDQLDDFNFEEAIELGVSDFIELPTDSKHIVNRIRFNLKFNLKTGSYGLKEGKALNRGMMDAIISYSPMIIYVLDYESKTPIYLNNRGLTLLEYSVEELDAMGNSFTEEIMYPEDLPGFFKHFNELGNLKIGETKEFEYRLVSKSGEIFWYKSKDYIFTVNEKGKPKRIIGIADNISAEKNIKKELLFFQKGLKTLNLISTDAHLNFEEKIQKALEFLTSYYQMEIGIISKIAGHNYTIKKVFSTMSNLELGEGDVFDLQNTYCDIVWKKKRVTAIHEMGKSKYSQLPCYQLFKLESYIGAPLVVNQKPYGTINFSSFQVGKTTFSTHEKELMVIFARWVASLLERKKYVDRLEKLNASKDRVLATVVHDLRNPLHNIKGLSYIIGQELLRGGDVSQFLNMVNESCDKADQLIKELLEIAELEDENFVMKKEEIELTDFIKTTVSALEDDIKAKKINLELKLPKESTPVIINRSKFSRVIENLVNNARKFTPENGKIKISLKKLKKEVEIKIADTGIGIPNELQPIIFDKFSRARREGLKGEASTGLGMSIVKQIVELHHGEIWLESRENIGSTFTIKVPRQAS
ncbi:ATP-binding protein [Flexithrix dorotheae]|uniref:ATP-binding protein n=1 Tax=Flexithrix dorotheae TaxID=70993 RepID=UPI000360FD15|nr:ATP-binding protein [Flexithrix dorotheae]